MISQVFRGLYIHIQTHELTRLWVFHWYIILLHAFHRYFITHEKYQLQLSWVFQGDNGNSMVIAWIYCPVVFSPISSVSVPFILMRNYRSVHHALETFFQLHLVAFPQVLHCTYFFGSSLGLFGWAITHESSYVIA